MNSNTLDPDRDMGADGASTGLHANFARDAFGFSLGYFEGDYAAIGSQEFLAGTTGSDLMEARRNLHNGNISHMVTTLKDPLSFDPLPQGTAYRYDALNRLVQMQAFNNIDIQNNEWKFDNINLENPTPYQTNYTYDANVAIPTTLS